MVRGEEKSGLLNIHNLCQKGTKALGPGLRFVIWTQGCPFTCEGCLTPESRSFDKGKLFAVDDLAERILDRPQIEGITISGGEPFVQAELLADLLDIVLTVRPELTVIIFSGYCLDELKWPQALRLLSHIDLLIDGPYRQDLNDSKGLRGSNNQQFHFLTPRLGKWKDEMENGKRKVEIHVMDEKIEVVGVPPCNMFGDGPSETDKKFL